MKQTLKTIAVVMVLLAAAVPSFAGETVPDLLKGEGPDPVEMKKAREDYFLHFWGTRGWMYKVDAKVSDNALQILVTDVPIDSRVRHCIKVGDVIVGVQGKMFNGNAVMQFREYAKEHRNKLSVILWRKSWPEPKTLIIEPVFTHDLTKGDAVNKNAKDWNLGATGARGWIFGDHITGTYHSRQILITKVDKGSPSDGILQKDDIILGVGGKEFTKDARRTFGRALTQAETNEGKGLLKLRRWREGAVKEVAIRINIMGNYSDTMPWNCKKSELILNNACAYLIRKGVCTTKGMNGTSLIGTMGLLATGNKNYMPIIKDSVYSILKQAESGKLPGWGYSSWGWSYANMLLSEYYLQSNDKRVLPLIRNYSEAIARGQSGVGTWGHSMARPDQDGNNGKVHGRLGGYGAMNQTSLTCLISLLLAQKCGVTSNEITQAIAKGKPYFQFYVDKGSVPYGDHLPGMDIHDDNGKSSSAAVFFDLAKDERSSTFFSKMAVASFNCNEIGHTGNFWSMLWSPLGARRSGEYGSSQLLKKLTWIHDMERRWDGGFVYQGNRDIGSGKACHNTRGWDTTGSRLLMYALPHAKLYITGREVPKAPISNKDADDAINAADTVSNLKDSIKLKNYSNDQLITLLSNWSPIVREAAAKALSDADETYVDKMVKLLDSVNLHSRYGGLQALRYTKHGNEAAMNAVLQKALTSKNLNVRLYAIHAFTGPKDRLHSMAHLAVDDLLKLAVKHDSMDPRRMIQRYLCFALFSAKNNNGINGIFKDGAGMEKVDATLLIPAIRELLTVADGKARSCVGTAYQKFNPQHLKLLWKDIHKATVDIAPSGIMFADGVRVNGLQMMLDHNLIEGVALSSEVLQERRWGLGYRRKMTVPILTQYAENSKVTIPKKDVSGSWNKEQLLELVKAIEGNTSISWKTIDELSK